MYKCHVEKRVWWDGDQSSDFTPFYYDLDVAQKPELGHQLRDGRWFSGPLTFVVWNVDDECFHCRVVDEKPSADMTYEYSHEFLVENALQEGWKRGEC